MHTRQLLVVQLPGVNAATELSTYAEATQALQHHPSAKLICFESNMPLDPDQAVLMQDLEVSLSATLANLGLTREESIAVEFLPAPLLIDPGGSLPNGTGIAGIAITSRLWLVKLYLEESLSAQWPNGAFELRGVVEQEAIEGESETECLKAMISALTAETENGLLRELHELLITAKEMITSKDSSTLQALNNRLLDVRAQLSSITASAARFRAGPVLEVARRFSGEADSVSTLLSNMLLTRLQIEYENERRRRDDQERLLESLRLQSENEARQRSEASRRRERNLSLAVAAIAPPTLWLGFWGTNVLPLRPTMGWTWLVIGGTFGLLVIGILAGLLLLRGVGTSE